MSWNQVRLVGPVDPHEAACRPVGHRRRARARAERHRPVERTLIAVQLVANVEVAGWRRCLRRTYSHLSPEDAPPVAKEGRRQPDPVDYEPGSDRRIPAKARARHPAVHVVRRPGGAYAYPEPPPRPLRLAGDEHEVGG